MGKDQSSKDHKNMFTHFVFDVNHDSRHKARLISNGYLKDVPLSSVYSCVVSLREIKLFFFLDELNGLESWGTDTGNDCLEVFTKEKVCAVSGPEFGHLEGHELIIVKDLRGLRTYLLRWHEMMSD